MEVFGFLCGMVLPLCGPSPHNSWLDPRQSKIHFVTIVAGVFADHRDKRGMHLGAYGVIDERRGTSHLVIFVYENDVSSPLCILEQKYNHISI